MTADVSTNDGGPKTGKGMGDTPSGVPRVEELGTVIERGKKAWRAVGEALEEIRLDKLYREAGYATFEAYLRGRHHCERAWGYKRIEAWRAWREVSKMSPIGDKIASAAQASALSPLAKKDARRAAKLLEELASSHGGVLPSARTIEAAVYREPGMGLVPSRGNEEAAAPEMLPVPPRVPPAAAAKVVAELDKTFEKHPGGSHERFLAGGRNSVDRDERQKALALKRAAAPPVSTSRVGEEIFVYHGDFESFSVEPGSARLVFADPPYNRQWTEDYAHLLAIFARDALEDGGFYVCYTGDAYALDIAQAALHAGLTPYGHVYALYRHGKQSLNYPKKTCPGKLLWVFAKGRANLQSPYRGLLDVGDSNLKEDHEWQQPIGEAEQLIEDFTSPGDLVVDPCVGSGTAAIAAARLGRRAICIEKDGATHRAAVRLVTEQLRLDRNFGTGNITPSEWEKAVYYAYEATVLPPSQRTAAFSPEGAEIMERVHRLWLAEIHELAA